MALENRQPPRHHGKSKVIQSSVLSAVEKKAIDGCSRKRTPEQKARRKAKLREAYLKKLQAAGKYEPSRPAKPDPERSAFFYKIYFLFHTSVKVTYHFTY